MLYVRYFKFHLIESSTLLLFPLCKIFYTFKLQPRFTEDSLFLSFTSTICFTAPLLLYLIIGLISSTDVVPRKRYLCQTDYAEYYKGGVYYCCYVVHSSSLQSNSISSPQSTPNCLHFALVDVPPE